MVKAPGDARRVCSRGGGEPFVFGKNDTWGMEAAMFTAVESDLMKIGRHVFKLIRDRLARSYPSDIIPPMLPNLMHIFINGSYHQHDDRSRLLCSMDTDARPAN